MSQQRHARFGGRKRRRQLIDSDDEEEPPSQRRRMSSQLSSQGSQRMSQRSNISSQRSSQSNGRDSQRKRRRGKSSVDEEEDYVTQGGISDEELEKLITKLMRMVLFYDINKKPIRRSDISQHVIQDYKKVRGIANTIIDEAKKRFRTIMGFDFVELPAKDGLKKKKKQDNIAKATKKRATTKKVVVPSTGIYILKNCVHTGDRDKRKEIKAVSVQTLDHELGHKQDMGLTMIILCIILANNRSITQELLYQHLKPLGFRAGSHPVFGEWEKKIQTDLVRKGYLSRVKTPRTDNGRPIWEFRIGQRSMVEVGWPNILTATAELYGECPDPIAMRELLKEQKAGKPTKEVTAADITENGGNHSQRRH